MPRPDIEYKDNESETGDRGCLKAKLLRNLGANAYGQLITVVIQLASIPLFLHFWGVDLYGEWLILSAIPVYLSLSDIGFASVAANDMTMRMAKGDRQGTLEVYQSIWFFICAISVTIACVLALLVSLTSLSDFFSFSRISNEHTQKVIFVMMFYVLIGLQGGVLSAAYRCVGRYAYGTLMNHSIRLAEWLISMVALTLGGNVLVVAMSMLVVRLAGFIIIWWKLRRQESWLSFGFEAVSMQRIRDLFKPAVAFMAFPLGLALSLQGVVLLIGATIGPAAVVVFSTYRTLTRLLVQVITMINQAVWPEMSAAFGAGQIKLVAVLHRRASSITFWIALVAVSVLWVIGDWIIGLWTSHAFEQNDVLLFLLLVTIFLNVLWQSSWVVMMAGNMHQKISIVFIVCAACGLLGASLFIPVMGINGVGVALVIAELPLLYMTINSSLLLLNDSWPEYAKSVISNPLNRKTLNYEL